MSLCHVFLSMSKAMSMSFVLRLHVSSCYIMDDAEGHRQLMDEEYQNQRNLEYNFWQRDLYLNSNHSMPTPTAVLSALDWRPYTITRDGTKYAKYVNSSKCKSVDMTSDCYVCLFFSLYLTIC